MAENLVVNDVTYPAVESISMTNENGEQVAFYYDAVRYNAQELTEAQKQQARDNIGAGTSSFSGNYNDLTDKPTIPTSLAELTEDTTHRTVTDEEIAEWSGKSDFSGNYNDLTDKPTITTETWTFTLEDGSTVTKAVYVG